ncbi:phosphoribosyltransferase [soil metagenome]
MFEDRFDAAEKLAHLLEKYAKNSQAIILAIPRGGIELGYVLAKRLYLPLDVIFTKKIGLPMNPEYAIGAVSSKHVFINNYFIDMPELQSYIETQIGAIRATIKERENLYRKGMAPFDLTDRIVIVVDDGVATGSTLLATIALIKEYHPSKIVVALPVCAQEAFNKIAPTVDEIVCVEIPNIFYSVGQFYRQFAQVEDKEAIRLLHEANS